jgi:aerobic carbon-monoxide dehydrogenase small subunit
MKKQVAINVNGERFEALVEPRTHLADFLREECRLTGTHLGCEHGVCGACNVLLDGKPVRSCITYAVACEGREVRTIEGFDDDALMNRLRAAFTRHHGLQCGFCTPGMLITSRDICSRLPGADEKRVRTELSGNLCRCTGYVGIVKAVNSVLADAANTPVTAAAAAPAPAPVTLQRFTPVAAAPAANAAPMAVATAEAAAPADDRKGMTRIEDRFTVPHPPEKVWAALGDLETTAKCLPGAELTEHDARSAKGRIRIKFGPMAAAFNGAATLERNDAAKQATFRGAGTDSLSGSRARGDITYRVAPENGGPDAGGQWSRVDVTLDYSLVGPLAQFSRSGLVKDFAGRLIAEFGRNLSARIAAPDSTALPAAELKAGSMFIGVLWRRLLALFGIK